MHRRCHQAILFKFVERPSVASPDRVSMYSVHLALQRNVIVRVNDCCLELALLLDGMPDAIFWGTVSGWKLN